jgi:hypothetical protein
VFVTAGCEQPGEGTSADSVAGLNRGLDSRMPHGSYDRPGTLCSTVTYRQDARVRIPDGIRRLVAASLFVTVPGRAVRGVAAG